MDSSSNMTAFQQAAGQVISQDTHAARGWASSNCLTLSFNQ